METKKSNVFNGASQKGSVNLALVGIIIVLAGAIGYLLLLQKQSPISVQPTATPSNTSTATIVPTLTLTPISTPTPTPSSNPDITADWNVIRDEKAGYEFKYPKNLDLGRGLPPRVIINFTFKENNIGTPIVKDKKITVAGKQYSLTVIEGFAAGSTYRDYYYTVNKGLQTFSLYFPVGYATDCKTYAAAIDQSKCEAFKSGYEKQIEDIVATFKFIGEQTSKIKLFFINTGVPEDNGPVGCGDEAIGIERTIPSTATPLKSALEALLAEKDSMIGQTGLYNSLARQNWKLSSVSIASGEAIIKLTGEYIGVGVCEDPRIKAQLEKTALQFPSVKKVSIFLNGVSLDKITSGRGE